MMHGPINIKFTKCLKNSNYHVSLKSSTTGLASGDVNFCDVQTEHFLPLIRPTLRKESTQ